MILPNLRSLALLALLSVLNAAFSSAECDRNKCDAQTQRFLLYGVNFGEGFNLRRDVYLRIANVIRQLRQDLNFVLVLPLWSTPHWRHSVSQAQQWSEFFDLPSLNRFVPVMEFDDYVQNHADYVESLLYLQHYSEGWNEGEYVIKYDLRPCIEADSYFERLQNGNWKSIARSLRSIQFKRLRCLSIQGESSTVTKAIHEFEPETRNLFIDRVETILHDNFGDKFYWQARRSMRYSDKLVAIGDEFRRSVLGSTDKSDKTLLDPNWEDQQPKPGSALGGDYLCVHWRRQDFVKAHKNEVPSIQGTVNQVSKLLRKLGLNKVFVSTDAKNSEYFELDEQLSASKFQVSRFQNSTLSEGAVSIIDQWICSHARHFIGTHVSTFSYRIHEDREILGFHSDTTFNRLCADGQVECEQPAQWTIVYD